MKCQQIMTDRMGQNDWEEELGETEQQQELILNALELFQKCLSDCNDGLSESVDDVFVKHFVYHVLSKFSTSSPIQGKGASLKRLSRAPARLAGVAVSKRIDADRS